MSGVKFQSITCSGSVIFRVEEYYRDAEIAICDMEFDVIEPVSRYMPERWKATFFKGDALRLAKYLESALAAASRGRGVMMGYPFLTNGLDFEIWVVGGEIEDDESYLRVAIMVSNREMAGDGTGASVGFTSYVDDTDIISFCQQLRSLDLDGIDR